jgi:hypothetical protein
MKVGRSGAPINDWGELINRRQTASQKENAHSGKEKKMCVVKAKKSFTPITNRLQEKTKTRQ